MPFCPARRARAHEQETQADRMWLSSLPSWRAGTAPRVAERPENRPGGRGGQQHHARRSDRARRAYRHARRRAYRHARSYCTSAELMAHTHTLLCSSFSSVRRVSLHLPMHLPMHPLLSSGRSSYFRVVSYMYSFIFYLSSAGRASFSVLRGGWRHLGVRSRVMWGF